MSQFLVYALQHDDSPHVYIGKSSAGLKRPRCHFKSHVAQRHGHLPVYKWLGKYPDAQIVVLEECASSSEAASSERFYIEYLRSVGVSLLNCTDGGEGMYGYKASAETRRKMSTVHKARTNNPEHVARFVAMSRAYRKSDHGVQALKRAQLLCNSPEAIKKKSATMKITAQRPDVVTKRREAHRLSKTPEAIEKQAAAMRGRKFSDEHRRRMSEARRGKKLSAEWKAKIGAAHCGMKRPPSVGQKIREMKITPLSEFDGVDWSLPDRHIGKQVGRSHGVVSRARRRLGLPSSTHARKKVV